MKPVSGADVGSKLDLRHGVSERVAWIETIVVTTLSILLPAFAHPSNPFYVDEGFPWPALGPVLCGLRYGFANGFTSALMLIIALGTAINQHWWVAPAFPFTYAVGVIIAAMLCGEFRDIWQRRVEKLQAANDYRAERLEEFTRAHHLLRISHDQLEQQLAGTGFSLREMLAQLSSRFARTKKWDAEQAQIAMSFLSELGSLQAAAIYAINNDHVVVDKALAQCGEAPTLQRDDAMLKRCLRERQTIAVTADVNGIELAQQSQWLACVPFVDAHNCVHAVLVIAAMPFFALTEVRLRLLSIAAAHLCDHVLRDASLDQQHEFDVVLSRMAADAQQFGVASSLVMIRAANNDDMQSLFAQWQAGKRALDVCNVKSSPECLRLCILLPITSTNDAQKWLARFPIAPSNEVRIEAVDENSINRVATWLRDNDKVDA